MNPLTVLYNEVLFRPLFNLLVGMTNILPHHNVGLSILAVTLFVRLLLLAPAVHQARLMQTNQSKMSDLKSELMKIRERYKTNPTKKAEATMALYRQAGINPARGCLPLLIQLPILIALYRVFLIGLGPETYSYLYSFVSEPATAQMSFLGLDLARASVRLAIAAGVAQFALMRLSTPPAMPPAAADSDTNAQLMAGMQRNMAYIFPAMTVFISLQLPAALSLYWVASTIFGIVQQYIFQRFLNLKSSVAV
ncbi:MAG: membrane protein insertase YidC [Candidatus Andersenbacteria bacterium]|nr:membrane protein insertase YidC [Candidatus Andersenbacteria bacterium]